MNEPMNCDRFAELLPDLLERDVPEPARATMESHALSCDECGPLLADLRHLRVNAANLPELAPSRDLWSGIAARIETPVVALPAGASRTTAPVMHTVGGRRLWLGLAAAALIAVTATITHEMTKRSIATTTVATNVAAAKPVKDSAAALANVPVTAVATTNVDSAKSPMRSAGVTPETTKLVSNKTAKPTADQTYDHEIAKLRAVVEYRRHDLDSTTVAVVDKNLRIIDDAIAQCRSALKKDPASRYLLESLNEALDNKVQLLRTAATLPPRT
jgi:hypothetical protein